MGLKEFRQSRYLTQEEFALEVGVHWRTVHRIESGESGLTQRTLKKIAEGFHMTPRELDIAIHAEGQTPFTLTP